MSQSHGHGHDTTGDPAPAPAPAPAPEPAPAPVDHSGDLAELRAALAELRDDLGAHKAEYRDMVAQLGVLLNKYQQIMMTYYRHHFDEPAPVDPVVHVPNALHLPT